MTFFTFIWARGKQRGHGRAGLGGIRESRMEHGAADGGTNHLAKVGRYPLPVASGYVLARVAEQKSEAPKNCSTTHQITPLKGVAQGKGQTARIPGPIRFMQVNAMPFNVRLIPFASVR